MPERVCLTSSGIGWKLCPRKKREWGRQHKSSSCSWKVRWAGPEAGNESVTWFKLFCLCRVHNFSQSTRVISWRCPGEKTTDVFMGDHYNDVNGHLSTVTMSDTLTHVTNEVRETQIFQLFLAFKITFQWTFMNLRAERLLQTSFLSKGQCLFWTSQFGRICFAWTFCLCRSPPGYHISFQDTQTMFQVGSSNISLCKPHMHHLLCHSLYFPLC